MSDNAQNDLIKIKEDAIRIQEADLLDTFNSIQVENQKSYHVLLFVSGLIAFIIGTSNFPPYLTIIISVIGLSSALPALKNMRAKKVDLHEDIDYIFKSNSPTSWKERLDIRHKSLEKCSENAYKLLKERALRNNASLHRVALLTLLTLVAYVVNVLT
ncbi:MAG: hypothetical protein OXF52_03020 [Candidatus Dadabacteria bacterium]|nr:hypothetical protein [Candidatus Dadabacteria bacterium]